MQYLTLLYDDEANGNEPGTPEFDAEIAAYMRFGEIAGEAIVAGEALEPAATARTVRPGAGAATVTAALDTAMNDPERAFVAQRLDQVGGGA